MKTNYLNNSLFRIFSPPITAFVVYLFILLISDRLAEISNNFNPEELLVLIIINYSLFEAYRKSIAIIKPKIQNLLAYNIILHLINFGLTILIVWGLFSAYFTFILNISGFSRELISIILVYILVGIFYHLFYLSISLLDKQQKLLLNKENLNRKNIEFEMELFKNKINPNFLFSTLETVITHIKNKEIQKAEDAIENLALFYRKILGNRYSEVISVENEIEKIQQYIHLQNYMYADNFRIINNNIKEFENKYIVPNSLLVAIQIIEACQILNSNQELEIEMLYNDNYIDFCFLSNYKLNYPKDELKASLKVLNKAVGFYSEKEAVWKEDDEITKLCVPLIEFEL